MTTKLKNIVLVFCVSLFGCTEDIELDIVGGSEKIVIEGSIENGSPATVIVTRNSSVSKPLDLENILVTNANVYVSDGVITEKLVLTIDSASSIPVAYKGTTITGVVGKTYFLTVEADGKTYTAKTIIPQPVALDSVYWKSQPPHDTLGYAYGFISEPKGYGNAYRWFAKRPSKDRRYIAPLGASFDDKFIDGEKFEFFVGRGIDPTSIAIEDNDTNSVRFFFKQSDTLFIKFCTTDYPVFRFYLTYETAVQSSGNPFASPTNVKSNIDNDGLGVWAGFGVSYDTIFPKK